MFERRLSDKHFQVEFDDWSDLVRYASLEHSIEGVPEPSARRSHKTDDREWFGSGSFTEAKDLALNGWPSGLDKVKRLSGSLIERIGHKLKTHDIYFDVTGAHYDMGRLIEGDPECWLNFEEIQVDGQSHNTAHIYFNMSVSGGVSAEEIIKRGSIAVALVELLELSGVSVRLDLVQSMSTGYRSGTKYEGIIPLKDYTQDVDLNRLAFTLCHPSMLRRLYFGVCEQLAETHSEVKQAVTGGGYGYPADFKAPDGESSLVLDKVLLGTDASTDTDKILLNLLSKFGIEIAEPASTLE